VRLNSTVRPPPQQNSRLYTPQDGKCSFFHLPLVKGAATPSSATCSSKGSVRKIRRKCSHRKRDAVLLAQRSLEAGSRWQNEPGGVIPRQINASLPSWCQCIGCQSSDKQSQCRISARQFQHFRPQTGTLHDDRPALRTPLTSARRQLALSMTVDGLRRRLRKTVLCRPASS